MIYLNLLSMFRLFQLTTEKLIIIYYIKRESGDVFGYSLFSQDNLVTFIIILPSYLGNAPTGLLKSIHTLFSINSNLKRK